MIKSSMKLIGTLYRYAPLLTVLKLLQSIVGAVLSPLSIYFTQKLIDTTILTVKEGALNKGLLFWGVLLLFSLFFASVGNGFFNGILHISLKHKLNILMTPDILEKLKKIDFACFEDKDVHDTLSRMTSDPQEKVLDLYFNICNTFGSFISMAGALLIFMQAGWYFVVGFILLFTPTVWLDFKVEDLLEDMYDNQSTDERRMKYLGSLLSTKGPLLELRVFRSVEYIISKWKMFSKIVLDERLKKTLVAQRYAFYSAILYSLWSLLSIVGLTQQLSAGNVSLGLFTALVVSTETLLEFAAAFSYLAQDFRRNTLLLRHYFSFMNLPETQQQGSEEEILNGKIEFKDVTFKYPGSERNVLSNLSFRIEPGEKIALVGANGAGKSTMIKLLLGLYKPDSGRVLIDGNDVYKLNKNSLRKVFSVIFQDYCEYQFTLRENVAFGDLSMIDNDYELNRALKLAQADNITKLDAPLGKLDENGVDCSGGEWQRIALARGCLAQSKLLILDEPTASLDPIAESGLYRRFSDLMRDRGCILISHRLGSSKMADRILVIRDGCVCEEGTHIQLMKSSGYYAEMYEKQSSWYREEVVE